MLKAAVLYDVNTNKVLYKKTLRKMFPSIATKTMTANFNYGSCVN